MAAWADAISGFGQGWMQGRERQDQISRSQAQQNLENEYRQKAFEAEQKERADRRTIEESRWKALQGDKAHQEYMVLAEELSNPKTRMRTDYQEWRKLMLKQWAPRAAYWKQFAGIDVPTDVPDMGAYQPGVMDKVNFLEKTAPIVEKMPELGPTFTEEGVKGGFLPPRPPQQQTAPPPMPTQSELPAWMQGGESWTAPGSEQMGPVSFEGQAIPEEPYNVYGKAPGKMTDRLGVMRLLQNANPETRQWMWNKFFPGEPLPEDFGFEATPTAQLNAGLRSQQMAQGVAKYFNEYGVPTDDPLRMGAESVAYGPYMGSGQGQPQPQVSQPAGNGPLAPAPVTLGAHGRATVGPPGLENMPAPPNFRGPGQSLTPRLNPMSVKERKQDARADEQFAYKKGQDAKTNAREDDRLKIANEYLDIAKRTEKRTAAGSSGLSATEYSRVTNDILKVQKTIKDAMTYIQAEKTDPKKEYKSPWTQADINEMQGTLDVLKDQQSQIQAKRQGGGKVGPLKTGFSQKVQTSIADSLRTLKQSGKLPSKQQVITELKSGHPKWSDAEIGKIYDHIKRGG